MQPFQIISDYRLSKKQRIFAGEMYPDVSLEMPDDFSAIGLM